GGYKLRPRAVTLTMFVRLYLADLFVHGIGGGKYDELTDAIVASFFRVTPPAYAVVTGTLRLPFPSRPDYRDRILAERRHRRDWRWNPQLFIEPERRKAVDALIASRPSGRAEREQWFRDIRAA